MQDSAVGFGGPKFQNGEIGKLEMAMSKLEISKIAKWKKESKTPALGLRRDTAAG